MKLNQKFILKKIDKTSMLIPIGDNSMDMENAIKLNESGTYIYKLLLEGLNSEEIIRSVTDYYQIDADLARSDYFKFLDRLLELGVLND